MLALSFQEGESAFVELPDGDMMRIELVRGSDGRAQLGFVAPDRVRIYRQKVWDEIVARRQAVASDISLSPGRRDEGGLSRPVIAGTVGLNRRPA